MISRIPTATCRIQLREGVDFDTLGERLDQIADLGVSHLYLSPIFTATQGSTHGYDVTDPTEIDPVLGGREGFERLAGRAKAKGLGIILDIVPNHTAFSVQNPWLADVLRHGRASTHARAFDIDWSAGPLVLPWLPEAFDKMLTDGAFRIQDGFWHFGDLALPLADGTDHTSDLRALHEGQHWRLVHYALERDGITHRRFFNVTDLIGMRVEDPSIFDATHDLIVDLVQAGLVHGLRIDHIDGLADPAGYLERLVAAVPDTPLWIEKILVGDEELPSNWTIDGTTGYEAGYLITRMLTRAEGIGHLDAAWREAIGPSDDFAQVLTQAKHEVLANELAAERIQLARMAGHALASDAEIEPGPEALREAVTALLVAMPVYRSYVTASGASEADQTLIARVADQAAEGLRSDDVLRKLAAVWAAPATPAQVTFVTRLQQVSGALLAKAQEDTAGFRWTRYLPVNEVGAEPDHPSVTAAEATDEMRRRRPGDMVLTSSHDSKRSEDARARLIAASHLPEDLAALDRIASRMAEGRDVPPAWRWYMVQSAVALHGADEAAERLEEHVRKAMREAKETSFWTRPDEEAEGAVADLGRALLEEWQQTTPPELSRLLDRGDAVTLAQLLFKAVMPGFPDIYQGTQVRFLALTDPDNRRAVNWDALSRSDGGTGLDDVKAAWTHALLAMRHDHPALFAKATATAEIDEAGMRLIRQHGDRRLVARLDLPGSPADQGASTAVLNWTGPDGSRVRLTDSDAR